MKVLLLSVSAGQGHHQCAMALIHYLEQQNIACEMMDTLGYINPLIGKSVSQGYLLSTQLVPGAYGKGYRLAEKRRPTRGSALGKVAVDVLSTKIKKFIQNYNPDVIVCTHVFAAQILSDLSGVEVPSIGIVTDFTIHPFWEETALDYYVVASELLTHQARQKMISQDQLLPFGIPINQKFGTKIDKQQARRLLGIEDKPTIFLMSGSMGYGNLAKQIKRLDGLDMDFQMVCVCGNNQRVKRMIDGMETQKKLYNYGYVDNVDMMMDAADVIVTKPGGLTVSESLAKRLPMVFIDPIPGQEDRNAEFLLNNGAAMLMSPTFPVDECLYQLLSGHGRLQHMAEVIDNLAKPNAARDLGEFIIELAHSR